MVNAVAVDVLVDQGVARTKDERGAHLGDALARLVYPEAALAGLPGYGPGPWMEHGDERACAYRRRVRGARVVVDEDEVGNLLVANERRGVVDAPSSDRDNVGTGGRYLGIVLTQLRGMLAAMQSPEVAQEDQNEELIAPEVAEPVVGSLRVGERAPGQRGDVHQLPEIV